MWSRTCALDIASVETHSGKEVAQNSVVKMPTHHNRNVLLLVSLLRVTLLEGVTYIKSDVDLTKLFELT